MIPVGPHDSQVLTVVRRVGDAIERRDARRLRLRPAGRHARLSRAEPRRADRRSTTASRRPPGRRPMLSSAAMTHVFIAPHPDDVALSCGGLIASLRELGQAVTIITVYSGGPAAVSSRSVTYQREALGFGNEDRCGRTRRPSTAANIAAEYPVAASVTAGAAMGSRRGTARRHPGLREHAGAPVLAARRLDPERERHQRHVVRPPARGRAARRRARSPGRPSTPTIMAPCDAPRTSATRSSSRRRSSTSDLPDAIHRGYEGDDALLGTASGRRRASGRPAAARDHAPRAAARVRAPWRRRARRPPAVPRCGAGAPRGGPRWVMPAPDLARRGLVLRGLPVCLVERVRRAAMGSTARLPSCRTASRWSHATRTSATSWSARRPASGSTRARSRVSSMASRACSTMSPGYAARVAGAGRVATGAAERYWAVVRT